MDENLKYKLVQYNAYSILRQMDESRLNIDADFKDRKTWTTIRKSQYVESIILGIPAQPIWCEENTNGDYIVIDGSERIRAIKDFMLQDFKLTKLRIRKDYEGLTFKDLPYHEILNIQDRFTLPFIVINYDTPQYLKAEFYWRLLENQRTSKTQSARNFAYRNGLNFLRYIDEKNKKYISFNTKKNIYFNSKINEFYLFLLLILSISKDHLIFNDNYTIENGLDDLMSELDMKNAHWRSRTSELSRVIRSITRNGDNPLIINLETQRHFQASNFFSPSDFYSLFINEISKSKIHLHFRAYAIEKIPQSTSIRKLISIVKEMEDD